MSAYIKSLRAHVADAARDRGAQADDDCDAAARTARELTPLHERLSKLLATVPAADQAKGLSLPNLAPRLRGLGGGEANAGQVGTALRRLGWRRERKWRGGDVGFRAVWLPPTA